MVIEHTFVTTLESNEALNAASEFLGRAGFVAEAQSAFQLDGGGWTTLQMRRGRKSATRAKDATQCPQMVRLEWDRGRVSVAAMIEPRNDGQRLFLWGGIAGLAAASASKKSAKQCSALMVTLANSLEALLARRAAEEEANREWLAMEQEIREKARKARIRGWIYLTIFLVLVIGAIVFIAMNVK